MRFFLLIEDLDISEFTTKIGCLLTKYCTTYVMYYIHSHVDVIVLHTQQRYLYYVHNTQSIHTRYILRKKIIKYTLMCSSIIRDYGSLLFSFVYFFRTIFFCETNVFAVVYDLIFQFRYIDTQEQSFLPDFPFSATKRYGQRFAKFFGTFCTFTI